MWKAMHYPLLSFSVGTQADQLTNSAEVALPFKAICLCVSSWVGTVRHSGPMPECLLLCHSVPLSAPRLFLYASVCQSWFVSGWVEVGGVCAVPLRVWEWGHTYTHTAWAPIFTHSWGGHIELINDTNYNASLYWGMGFEEAPNCRKCLVWACWCVYVCMFMSRESGMQHT